ncbi:MAG TPA: alanine--tRNA ligase [Bacteroidota bacterium]|nr:alanine--tRNA ligase [Bacteroidota bacterium]
MTSREIRQSFLDFFSARNHRIVPSAPVIPHGDPTLLFTNAGMNQFKEVFLGTGKRDYTRAADTQKCIRVSGKHNDLEEVGRDTYHHTFFEMLGNWSFGDYYKKEAIAWAWELLTVVWKLPKKRLWATVYQSDDESFNLWKSVTDINPSHILRFGEKDNFWEMGETGPCGPCSEIHIDLTPEGNATAAMVNAGTSSVIEIWNLVFIQHNRLPGGKLENLPMKHVDTGMGFERVCAVMEAMKSNFAKPSSNYDSDVFMPIIQRISALSGKPYGSNSDTDVATRVVADHIRALTFAIGDGAIPSNEGRGYVLRRILRRAARFGRNLGFHEPFLFKLVDTLVATMSHVFPEIKEHQKHIERVIKGEEEGFNQTLDRGLEIFEDAARRALSSKSKAIGGEDAFKLYDTFGFPLDLTQLLGAERGLTVDDVLFAKLMEEQKDRSRDSGKMTGVPSVLKFMHGESTNTPTEFLGYDLLESPAKIIDIAQGYVELDRTPFYGESGGQVGDTGELRYDNGILHVVDTQKDGNIFGHRIIEEVGDVLAKSVTAIVDKPRRVSVMRNHTATHLVHSALRQVLGTHVHQAGSLVAPDHLRFDFAHFAKVKDEEIAEIENIVNEKIKENIQLQHHRNIPFAEAQKMGALMFFGDKYGDKVNVVQFGEFSKEFCGGTHVKNTGEIGYFKIRSESSSASGVRRIEAITHSFAAEYLKIQNKSYKERVEYGYQLIDEIQDIQKEITRLSSGSSLMSKEDTLNLDVDLRKLEQVPDPPVSIAANEFSRQFLDLHVRFRKLEEYIFMLSEKKKSFEKELAKYNLRSAASEIEGLILNATAVDGFKVVASKVNAGDMDALKSIGDTLRSKIGSGVGLLASVIDDKVALVCVVSDDLIKTKNMQAGKIVGAVAKVVGGGGGGKPHLATAGGKDVSKLDEALRSVKEVVEGMMEKV